MNAGERKTHTGEFSVPIAADGVTIVEAAGFRFEASTIAAADASMPASLSVAMFDAAKIADAGLFARNLCRATGFIRWGCEVRERSRTCSWIASCRACAAIVSLSSRSATRSHGFQGCAR